MREWKKERRRASVRTALVNYPGLLDPVAIASRARYQYLILALKLPLLSL
jgi:hypothetical protein